MKALTYLLGARALQIASEPWPRRSVSEPALLAIASTPETAAAWRRWAEAGRAPEAQTARPGPAAAREPSTHGGAI